MERDVRSMGCTEEWKGRRSFSYLVDRVVLECRGVDVPPPDKLYEESRALPARLARAPHAGEAQHEGEGA